MFTLIYSLPYQREVGGFINIVAQRAQKKERKFLSFFVPRTRLELARANAHYPLKVACLPISPPGPFYMRRSNSAKKVCKYRYYFLIRKIFLKKNSPPHKKEGIRPQRWTPPIITYILYVYFNVISSNRYDAPPMRSIMKST